MYKELRSYASTGEAWAAPFLVADSAAVDRLKVASLRLDRRFRAIRRHVALGATVLDAGCGMGQWPVFLSRNGYVTMGLDFSDRMIEKLKGRYPALRWESGLVQHIPLSNESVDAVISWGVIEHDEHGPEQALLEYVRVLRRGGYAFLTVPIDSPSQRLASQLHFAAADTNTFFQYFLSPEEFGRVVEAAGLVLVEPIRTVSSHHALAFPRLEARLQCLRPQVQRVAGWLLKGTLPFIPSAANMILAVAKKP